MSRHSLTADRVRDLLRYEPQTGALYWASTGLPAGTTDPDGYRAVQINRVIYRAHRLIWLYLHGHWPAGVIDHIDGDPGNNRPENLRDVSVADNSHNQRRAARHNRSSDCIGVSWQPSRSRWMASITLDGKTKFLGRFHTESEASDAYWAAKATIHPNAPCALSVPLV